VFQLIALHVFTRSETSWTWATVSGGGTFNLLSRPLQPGIRFFQPPKPALPTASLAVGLPCKARRKYGVSEFHINNTSNVGSANTPRVLWQRIPRCKRNVQPCTFWSKRINHISLYAADGAYKRFTCVSHITQPSLSFACD
jgi:hypothetical protein